MPDIKTLPLHFSTVAEVNYFFDNWHQLSELNRLSTIKTLRDSGNLSIINGKIPNSGDSCPLHSFPLAKPCSLTSCGFHLRGCGSGKESADLIGISAKYKNCLVGYLNDSKNNKLAAGEIAVLMGKPTTEVNGLVASAVTKLRKAIVKEKIEKLRIVRFDYLPGHCVNCEVSIHEELALNTLSQDLIIEWEKFGWCSKVCKDDKPIWHFTVEKEFKCDFVDAVAAASTVYTLDEVFELLEIPGEEQPWLHKKTSGRIDHIQRS